MILWALLICNFASQSLYFNVCALLPEFVDQNFPSLNAFDVGLLMAFYPIAFLVSAPVVGDRLDKLGRKNCLLAGILLMTIATLTFGVAGYFNNAKSFFSVSFIGRVLQGVGDAIICVSIPSIIAIEFPDE